VTLRGSRSDRLACRAGHRILGVVEGDEDARDVEVGASACGVRLSARVALIHRGSAIVIGKATEVAEGLSAIGGESKTGQLFFIGWGAARGYETRRVVPRLNHVRARGSNGRFRLPVSRDAGR